MEHPLNGDWSPPPFQTGTGAPSSTVDWSPAHWRLAPPHTQDWKDFRSGWSLDERPGRLETGAPSHWRLELSLQLETGAPAHWRLAPPHTQDWKDFRSGWSLDERPGRLETGAPSHWRLELSLQLETGAPPPSKRGLELPPQLEIGASPQSEPAPPPTGDWSPWRLEHLLPPLGGDLETVDRALQETHQEEELRWECRTR